MNDNDALECVDADNFFHLAHSISGLCPELRRLILHDCSLTDESILQNLGFFSSLESLDLRGNDFVNLPNDCISKLLKLEYLHLNNCRSLKSLPNLPPNIECVYLDNCQSLESLPTFPPNVKYVTALNCNSMKPPPDQYEQQILGVLAASMESECLRQETNKRIFEYRDGFRVPGSEIPLWFDHQNCCVQNKASSEEKDFGEISITVEIPDNCYKSECWGIAVCLVLQDMPSSDGGHRRLLCKSEIIGVEENHFPRWEVVRYIGFLEGPHLLIVPWRAQDLQFDQTKIQLTFYFGSEQWRGRKLPNEIKKCGYRVFSKEDAKAWHKIMTSQGRIEGLQSSNDDENDATPCDVEADQPVAKRTKLI